MKADKAKVSRLLKTARGQIDGVLKMIDEDQYCIDIANQIMAAEAVLQRANKGDYPSTYGVLRFGGDQVGR